MHILKLKEMKKIIYLIVGFALLIPMESCETTELDITLNPNALTEVDLGRNWWWS